jgi:hypothetical protein
VSAAGKKGGRFGYLTSATEGTRSQPSASKESGHETTDESAQAQDKSPSVAASSSGGGEGRSPTATRDELASVPKGRGRMKQERSQLNVRIPTMLKRQAAAKAVLEGRDIGEVVEELLREYLER